MIYHIGIYWNEHTARQDAVFPHSQLFSCRTFSSPFDLVCYVRENGHAIDRIGSITACER